MDEEPPVYIKILVDMEAKEGKRGPQDLKTIIRSTTGWAVLQVLVLQLQELKKKQKKNCRDAEGGCLIIFICFKYSFLCQKCLLFLLKVSLFDLFKSLDRKYSAFIV